MLLGTLFMLFPNLSPHFSFSNLSLMAIAEIHCSTEILLAFLRDGSNPNNMFTNSYMVLCVCWNDAFILWAVELFHRCQPLGRRFAHFLIRQGPFAYSGPEIQGLADNISFVTHGNSGSETGAWDFECVPLQPFSSDAYFRLFYRIVVSFFFLYYF